MIPDKHKQGTEIAAELAESEFSLLTHLGANNMDPPGESKPFPFSTSLANGSGEVTP